jgi:hypothetical protein
VFSVKLIYGTIAIFPSLLRIRSLSPFPHAADVPASTHIRSGVIDPYHDPSFSRAWGSR